MTIAMWCKRPRNHLRKDATHADISYEGSITTESLTTV
jgi:hypothetical protein